MTTGEAGNCRPRLPFAPHASAPHHGAVALVTSAEAGVPDGVYQAVTGQGSIVGDALIKSPKIEKIAFTGSIGVGRQLAKDAADTMKHVTLELGGKSPNVVMAGADLEKAVETARFAIFWNNGEICVAGSRLLVERPIYEESMQRSSRA